MARLRWTHLKNDSTTLYLNQGITKTYEGRTTPIPEAVARYLEKHRPEEGDDGFIFKGCRDDSVKGLSDEEEARRDVNRVTRLNVRLNRLKKSVRKHFPWPSNALRASALSYRVQLTGSTDRTAEEMGNSKTILKRTYQELTTEAEAKEWFATDPKEYPYGSTAFVSAFIQGKARGMKLGGGGLRRTLDRGGDARGCRPSPGFYAGNNRGNTPQLAEKTQGRFAPKA
jgi:hypothetical protein